MSKPIKLKTQRLLLRPFKLSDASDVYEYAKDPDWAQFLPLPSPYTYRDAEEFVARSFLEDWDAHPHFAITLCGTVVGSINLRVDSLNNAAEIGYAIGRDHWGKGITAEAASAALDWAFSEFDLARICARADLKNRQSWRVMEKLGMQREGVTRSSVASARDPDTREDTVTYSVLRAEWERLDIATIYSRLPVEDSEQQ